MKKKRGIILVSTLLLIFFLVLVSSAFININTNNLRLTTNVRDQELAVLAAMSGVKYAQMRIEQFQNDTFVNSWGGCSGSTSSSHRIFYSIGIPSGVNAAFLSPVTENQTSGIVTATLNNGAKFSMAFACDPITTDISTIPSSYNNLSSGTFFDRGPNYRSVPARSVHLIVVGSYGNIERTVEVILKKQALTDSSAFAGKDLTVNIAGSTTGTSSLWSINSVDPFNNSVRANGNITAPDLGPLPTPVPTVYNGTTPPKITFTSGSSLDPGGASLGAIVSNGNIKFASSSSSGFTVGDGPNDAEETQYVKQQTGGVLHPNTTSDPPPDLSASNFIPSGCVYSLASGTYQISGSNTIVVPSGSTYSNSFTVQPTTGSSSSCTSKTLYVKNYMLRIPNDVNIKVSGGNFELSGPQLQNIKLGLGYNSSGYSSTGIAPNFNVTGGDVRINGEVDGKGSIVADQGGGSFGGNVYFNGKSVLSTEPSFGLAVYADKDVNINSVQPVTSSNSDFLAYENAVKTNATTPTTTPKWLHNWGKSSYSGNTGTDSATLRDTIVGTATWTPGTLTIIPTDATTATPPITINIPSTDTSIEIGSSSTGTGGSSSSSSSGSSGTGSITVDAHPVGITLGQYVRAKKCEEAQDVNLLVDATGSSSSYTDTDVASDIKNKIDVFWADKESIESQVANTLERSFGFTSGTVASPTNYCSGCNTYGKYKNADVLVSFPDYWNGSSSGNDFIGHGFGGSSTSTKETNYKYQTGVYWDSSQYTYSSQTSSSNPNDAQFTGAIYTKGSLTANNTGHKFYIEGAIIAPGSSGSSGNITITAQNVKFLYNPEYLTKFMNQTGSSVQTRVTQVFWVLW